MNEKTREQLEKENADLRAKLDRMSKEWEHENRVIRLLIAAGLVSDEKIGQARDLATNLK